MLLNINILFLLVNFFYPDIFQGTTLGVVLAAIREGCCRDYQRHRLTAAMEGFDLSPAGGWVTLAPRKMTGSRKTLGL